MKNKLKNGEALDVGPHRISKGRYFLPQGFFQENVDYCDAETESWIWSIGRNKTTGEVQASVSTDFYQNAEWECLWLR